MDRHKCGKAAPQSVRKLAEKAAKATVPNPSPPRAPGGRWASGAPAEPPDWVKEFNANVAWQKANPLGKDKEGQPKEPAPGWAGGGGSGGRDPGVALAIQHRGELYKEIEMLLNVGGDFTEEHEEIKKRRDAIKKISGERPAHVQLRDIDGKIKQTKVGLEGKRKEKADLEISILELRGQADEIETEVGKFEEDVAALLQDKAGITESEVALPEPESIKGKELVAMVLPKGVRDDPGRKSEVEAVAELLQKLGAEVVPHRRAGGSEDGLDELPGLDEEAEVGMATDALLESPEFKSFWEKAVKPVPMDTGVEGGAAGADAPDAGEGMAGTAKRTALEAVVSQVAKRIRGAPKRVLRRQ